MKLIRKNGHAEGGASVSVSLPGEAIREREWCDGHTVFLRKPIRLAHLAAAIESATSASDPVQTAQLPDY